MTLKTSRKRNGTSMESHVKTFIVTLAAWGWLPIGLADWIIRHCHLGEVS